jgi:uncharacterized protein YkwD
MTSSEESGLSRTLPPRNLEESTDSSTSNVKQADAKRVSSHTMNALEVGNGAQRRGGQLLSRSEHAPRRVKSSSEEISQMARMSRRELMSSSVQVETDPSVDKKTKKATNDKDLLSNSEHRKSSLTTRPRGGDLSVSEHGTHNSGRLGHCPSSRPVPPLRRPSKKFDPIPMRYLTNSEDEGNDSTTTQKKIHQCSARPPRRTRSGGAKIDLLSRMARKARSLSVEIASGTHPDSSVSNDKNARWGASPSEASSMEASVALPGYNDMKQNYQQSWDRASCHVVVNEIRALNMLQPLQRDNDMDTEAQTFAEAIALSNGNAFLKIDYIAHVLHGTAVIAMHHRAMTQQHGSKSKAQANILNPDFHTMGVGVATGTNGLIYVCELFRGKFTLCCAPDVNK